MIAPLPSFEHIAHLTDEYGTFEHADHADARRGLGYCTDDVARVLLVASREPDPEGLATELAEGALRFLGLAQVADGRSRNRRTSVGRWLGTPGVEDCWGRSVWALGTAAARGPFADARSEALGRFERALTQRSPWRRASAFAALGAAEVVGAHPRHPGALALLADAAAVIGARDPDSLWEWPEARLTYANAVLPDALIAAGAALGRDDLLQQGLGLLAWLLDRETAGGHLSVTPVGGRGPEDRGPGFDQQPIEPAALADACARAAEVTGEARWIDGVAAATAWFLGDNDAGACMWDPSTGGGYDGLRADGPNLNQGAESTLALISTLQHARRIPVAS